MKRTSTRLSTAFCAVLSLSSTRLVFAAETAAKAAAKPIAKPIAKPAVTPPTLAKKPNLQSPLIGSPVPDFVLPDMSDKMWKLSQHIGKRPVLLLMVSGQPRFANEDDTNEAVLAVLVKHAVRLRLQNIDVVLATQLTKATPTSKDQAASSATSSNNDDSVTAKEFEPIHVVRDDGSLAKLYGVLPQRVVGALIDRYGILREINFWPFGSKALDAALQNVSATTSIVEPGKTAPDFALRDSSGQMRRLFDLRGRHNVLLVFFPEGSTCGCGSQLPSVENDLPQFLANNTQIWLLSSDNAQTQNELI